MRDLNNDLRSPCHRSSSSCSRFCRCAPLLLPYLAFNHRGRIGASLVAQRTPLSFLRSARRCRAERPAPAVEPSKARIGGGLARPGRGAPGPRPRGAPAPWAERGGARQRAGRRRGRWRGLWLSRCPRGSGCEVPGRPPCRRAGPGRGRGAPAFTSRSPAWTRRGRRGRRAAGTRLARGAGTRPPPALSRCSSPSEWRSARRRGGHGDPEPAPHPPCLLRPPLRPAPPLMARTSAGQRQPCLRVRAAAAAARGY